MIVPAGPVKIIYVLPQNIAANFKDKGNRPVMRVQCEEQEFLCHHIDVNGPSELKYNNDKPQKGDGRVWIETTSELTLT